MPLAPAHAPVVSVVPAWGFRADTGTGRWLAWLTRWTEYLAAAVLAVDVLVVFMSVI